MKKKVRLIHTTNGHNKYYEMEEVVNRKSSVMKVTYGRIDVGKAVSMFYDIHMWDKKYNEKINKGYVDVSSTITEFSLDDVFKNLDLLEERFK